MRQQCPSSQPQVKELGSENKIDYSEEDKVDEEIEWLTTDEEEEKQVDQDDDDDDDRSINIEEIDDDEKIDD
ncbi:hypothetical protein Tco_1179228, partial [Tanacetum coccineum]